MFSIYQRMDAVEKLQQLNISMAPHAKEEDQRSLIRTYRMVADDPRDIIDLDSKPVSDTIAVKELLK